MSKKCFKICKNYDDICKTKKLARVAYYKDDPIPCCLSFEHEEINIEIKYSKESKVYEAEAREIGVACTGENIEDCLRVISENIIEHTKIK